jgi:2-keto-3-deoxy-L-fuconate dehydrogenase
MGPAVAAEFLHEGAQLILHTTDRAAAQALLTQPGVATDPATPPAVLQWIEADFAEVGVADDRIARLVQQTGRLDVLINVNSHPPLDPAASSNFLADLTDDFWHSATRALLTELIFTTRAALRHMVPARRGKIVNFTSATGVSPQPKVVAYSTLRAGANGFTQAIGREVAPFNIQVNAIAQTHVYNPSYFPPEDLAANPERHERLKRMVPLGRLADGRESARLAVYLASEDADFLCGEVIKFSGGWS